MSKMKVLLLTLLSMVVFTWPTPTTPSPSRSSRRSSARSTSPMRRRIIAPAFGAPNAGAMILLLIGLVLLAELLLELLEGLGVVGVGQGGHHHRQQCQHQNLHLV